MVDRKGHEDGLLRPQRPHVNGKGQGFGSSGRQSSGLPSGGRPGAGGGKQTFRAPPADEACGNPSVKAIIFDWSGVISDDFSVIYSVTSRILKRIGAGSITRDEFREKFDPTYGDLYKSLGVIEGPEKIGRMFDEEFKKSGKRPHVFPFAKDVLKQVKGSGLKAAVLSSHPVKFLEEEIMGYGLCGFFDVVVGGAFDKSQHIEGLIKRLGVPKEEIIYVGDMTHDIDTGKKAGVVTAAVLSGYHGRDKLEAMEPQLMMNDIRDLSFVLGGFYA